MNWLNRFNASLKYIEEHLKAHVDIDVVAEKACLSKFYYYRMFQMVTDMSLGEHIRNRKMSLAAVEIQSTDRKIIDIALDYDYGSAEAFSRAFKAVHGVSPIHARKQKVKLKAYPPISFQLQLKGVVEMEYRIEKKETFEVMGFAQKFSSANGENYKDIAKLWSNVMKDGTFNKLLLDGGNQGCYGICMNHDAQSELFDYAIAVNHCDGHEDYKNITIPAGEYAIFGPVDVEVLPETWKRIYAEWLPATEYELTDDPQIEYYPPNDGEVTCEIWMPIKK